MLLEACPRTDQTRAVAFAPFYLHAPQHDPLQHEPCNCSRTTSSLSLCRAGGQIGCILQPMSKTSSGEGGQLFGSSVFRIVLEEGDHHGVLGQQLTYGKKVCAPFAHPRVLPPLVSSVGPFC